MQRIEFNKCKAVLQLHHPGSGRKTVRGGSASRSFMQLHACMHASHHHQNHSVTETATETATMVKYE
jgi:hypothetical protein